MKKVLLGAAVMMAITGCTQNEEFENESKKAEINFGSIVRNSTRADIVTTATFERFTVSGYKTTGPMIPDTQLAAGFIDGLDVIKDKDTDKWKYVGDTFYWPYEGKVQFFASSPAQSLNITAAGYPTFKYTVKEAALQEDLVAANLIDKDKTAGDLTFPFQHLLTQVNFSIKGDTPGFTYTVSKIELKDLKDSGTFTFDGTATVGAWSGLTATSASLPYACTENNVVTSVDAETKTALEESGKALFMLMPQDATTITLDVTYACTSEKGDGFSGTKTVTLSGEWTKGHSIRYILKLTSDMKPVTFGKPTVDEWAPDSVVEKPTPAN